MRHTVPGARFSRANLMSNALVLAWLYRHSTSNRRKAVREAKQPAHDGGRTPRALYHAPTLTMALRLRRNEASPDENYVIGASMPHQ